METPARIIFERQYRTPHSEGYHVLAGETRLGHLDLHFTHSSVYATLVLETTLPEAQVLDLIERIDESLVLSAEVEREDLLVTVFQGRQTGFYSDDYLDERMQRRARAGPREPRREPRREQLTRRPAPPGRCTGHPSSGRRRRRGRAWSALGGADSPGWVRGSQAGATLGACASRVAPLGQASQVRQPPGGGFSGRQWPRTPMCPSDGPAP